MTLRTSYMLAAVAIFVFCGAVFAGEKGQVRLFILSGQSNMHKLDPDVSFTPTLKAALPDDEIIVVKDAESGQSIKRWYKKWKVGKGDDPTQIGDMYDRLVNSVKAKIEGKKIDSVVFVWMQGERDAVDKKGAIYAECLKGLFKQLEKDLKRKDISYVIGRLSTFCNSNPHWVQIREAQVKVAKSNKKAAWVDTDELPRDGIHYTDAGFKTLGEKFAKAALDLLGVSKKK
ncbi:MAG: acetyl xylan esterase [Planctomycetes bacterium]|nr:acetyl xylan esterase [Planctomycetota bacterium]